MHAINRNPARALAILLALYTANSAMANSATTGVAAATPRAIEFADSSLPVTGMLVLPVAKGGVLTSLAQKTDAATGGAIVEAMRLAKFTADAGQTLTLYGKGPYPAVLLIGTGDAISSAVHLRTFGALAARGTANWPSAPLVVVPDAADVQHDAAEAALGVRLGEYSFGKWGPGRTAGAAANARPGLTFLTADAAAARASFQRDGEAAAAGVWFARDLISTPSNVKTPEWFATAVRERFKDVPNTTVTVLDERQIKSLGMGGLLGTGQGSAQPPRLVAIEYRGGKPGEAPIAFVGKGITFDSGGISIKPADGMWRMRSDMSGAAATAGALLTLAQRSARVNAVAVLAIAENMPDGNSMRPGDVLTTMSGKTIEVLNTDAEGRLVLADALWWVQEKHAPRLAVTIATLTGAVVRALGPDHAGLFTHDDALATRFLDAGKAAGEALWRLPVSPATVRALKSDIADVQNVTEGGSAPGASFGAAFIMEWVKPQTPFVHIDIAGTAWESTGRPTEPKGAVGFGVRLFDEFVRRDEAAGAAGGTSAR
jgi:leucyl aminopeptidase